MKQRKTIIVAGIAVIIVGILWFILSRGTKVDSFPFVFEDGKLEMNDLITFDGPNPDNNNVVGESIASLHLTNHSQQLLKSLTIELKMENNQKYQFVIEDLPASASVIALDTTNAEYDGNTKCQSISYKCKFEDGINNESIDCQVIDSSLIVKNNSSQALKNIEITYRCLADGFYFGGQSYHIAIPELLSGKNETYNDEKCFMGIPEVIGVNVQN